MALKSFLFTKLLASSALVSCIIALAPAADAGNYTACKRLDDFTNGKSCICIQSDRRKKKDQVGGGFQENCAGVRVTNINVPSVTGSPGNGDDDDDDDDDGTSGLGNPGNAKPVGHAGEGPPNGTQDSKMNAPSVGGPGTRGASDGPGGAGASASNGGGRNGG
jgi:hypothetical protein